jgi:polyisoprenoid-binding protein YceI
MKTAVIIGIGVALVLGLGLLAAAFAVYYFVLGPTLGASGPITAIPVVVNTPAPAAATATPVAVVATSAAAPAASEAPAATQPAQAASGHVIFVLDSSGSQARFLIDEELRGQPKTVTGATNQIAGELAVDAADLSGVQVGVIQINARTFATDSGQRDRAIRNFILQTDRYEFITFTPTAVTGLSGSATPGDTLTFEIAGDLTIRDITQPVVFAVTASADSPTQISGTATASINRADFSLTIPSVPQVANVGETVSLEFDFLASAT